MGSSFSRAWQSWSDSKANEYSAIPDTEGAAATELGEDKEPRAPNIPRKPNYVVLALLCIATIGVVLLIAVVFGPSLDLGYHKSGVDGNADTESCPSGRPDIKVPKFDAKKVSPPVSKSFPGFAFEERSFMFYAGPRGEPNVFSQNLILEVADRTKTTPIIRVGGTSLDHSTYDANQDVPVKYAPGTETHNVPRNMTFGPSFFDSFVHFPKARYILSVGMAMDNLSNTLEFIRAGDSVIKEAAQLYSISVGNEPNLYAGRARPPGYGIKDWVKEFKKYTDTISDALGIEDNMQMYDAEALSAHTGKRRVTTPWPQRDVFDNGLDALTSRIKSVSMHYYQALARGAPDLQPKLMNHTALVNGMRYFVNAIQFLRKKGIPLDLAEVGSALNTHHNNHENLEGVFGAALWQVDCMLHAMALGVHRVNMQQGIGFGFAMWQPVEHDDTPAHVRAPYYAHVFAADFIGSSGGEFQVAEIDLHQDLLAAYAGYENGELVRVAILNLKVWTIASGTDRPVKSLLVQLPLSSGHVRVERLTSIEGARALRSQDMSWAGTSWTVENDGIGLPSFNDSTTVEVRCGTVKVDVHASEAIVLYMND